MDEASAVENAFGATVEIAERVTGDAAEADDDAGVLHGVVGIIEHRAHAADGGAERLSDHFVEPIGVDHFEVVVEQAEDGALGLFGGEIIDRAVIERRVVGDDANGFFGRDGFEIGERGGIVGAVVDDEDLVVPAQFAEACACNPFSPLTFNCLSGMLTPILCGTPLPYHVRARCSALPAPRPCTPSDVGHRCNQKPP